MKEILISDGRKEYVFPNPGKGEYFIYTYQGKEYKATISKNSLIRGEHVLGGSVPDNGQKAKIIFSVALDKNTPILFASKVEAEIVEDKIGEDKIGKDEKGSNMNLKSYGKNSELAFDAFENEVVKPFQNKLEEEINKLNDHYKGVSEELIKLKDKQNLTAKYLEENLSKGGIEDCKRAILELNKKVDEFVANLEKKITDSVNERLNFTDDLIEKFIQISSNLKAKMEQNGK